MKEEAEEDIEPPQASALPTKVYIFKARAPEAAVLLFCPFSWLPVVASTSRPHPSHYKVHAGPCEALGHEGGGGADGEAPRVVPADVGKVRMNGSRWAPDADAGEGAEGVRGGQSLVSVGVDGDSPRVGADCHERGFARRQEAHGAAHTRSHAHRRARRPPGCPLAEARSNGLDGATEASRGGVNAGTGAWGTVVSRAWTRSPRGGGRRGVTGVGGGSLYRGPGERSVGGRANVGGRAQGGRSWACGRRGSR